MPNRVPAKVRGLSQFYASGLKRMEIWIHRKYAEYLPCEMGSRVPIELTIGDRKYLAGIRMTARNDVIWICPNLSDENGEALTLSTVLETEGFGKNESLFLEVEQNRIRVLKAD